MDIGRCFKDAWSLLMKDLAPLAVTAAVGAVIVNVVSYVTGRLAGAQVTYTSGRGFDDVGWGAVALSAVVTIAVALVVGAWQYSTLLKIMLRRVRDGHAATMDDLRLGLDGIGAFIVAMLVLGIVVGIGFVFLIIPGLILLTIWAYVLVLVADRQDGLGEAMSGSQALAKGKGYLATFGTLFVGWLVIFVISGVFNAVFRGAPVIGQIIGMFVSVFGVCYLVAMYFQATGETHLLDHALYDAPLPAAPAVDAAGYPPAPPTPTGGTAYPPAPAASMGGAPIPPPPAPPAPTPTAPTPAPAPTPDPAVPPPPRPAAPAPAPDTPAASPAPPATPDAWASAADPLAAPPAPEPAPFEPPATSEPPSASVPPVVDETSGKLAQHCSQCGAVIEGSDEFCQFCALEASAGEGDKAPAGRDQAAGESDETKAT
jgi:outer membrane biosynthesis protein TonB